MSRGRPRTFDLDRSLEQAMRVFWKHGYDGASLSDLTNAMGISRPSLYAAFGDKESLFLRTLDWYGTHPASYFEHALKEETVAEVFRSLLCGVIDLLTDPRNPGGCLIVHGALVCSEDNEKMRDELTERRLQGERSIAERYEKARADLDLPIVCDPAALAKFTTTFMWGLAVQAKSGATRDELLRAARIAIDSFPGC